jgi:hypothetical protein
VVVEGVTVTLPTLAGLGPVLAVQTKGPAPLADKAWLCPKQIVDTEGVMATVDEEFTFTVMVEELTQLPTVSVTV